MTEKTLPQTIIDITTDQINRQRPQPTIVTITQTHNNGYIDIQDTKTDEIIKNIQYIGTQPQTGDKAILLPLANNQQVVITK